jgi:hypothetical protein
VSSSTLIGFQKNDARHSTLCITAMLAHDSTEVKSDANESKMAHANNEKGQDNLILDSEVISMPALMLTRRKNIRIPILQSGDLALFEHFESSRVVPLEIA